MFILASIRLRVHSKGEWDAIHVEAGCYCIQFQCRYCVQPYGFQLGMTTGIEKPVANPSYDSSGIHGPRR